jgi:acetyltransferase-like isoleucine patch superfamily enzyme
MTDAEGRGASRRTKMRNEYARTGKLPLSAYFTVGLRDLITQPFWLPFKFLGGTVGFKFREWLWRGSLGALGKGSLIDLGVEITNPKNVYIGCLNLIDKYVSIHAGDGEVRIGHRCHFAPYASVLGHGGVEIGNCVAIASGARIFSISDWPGDGKRCAGPMVPDEQRNLNRGKIIVGDDAFIGLNVVIMPGVTIGKGAVVGSNSVVTKDIDPWKIAVGLPAKPVADREPVTVEDLPVG